MSFKNGDVIEGTVKKITKYGAFIELPNGQTGLCHISEISNDFVKDINEYLKADQKLKVKILNIKEDGKIELSIKALTKPVSNKRSKPSDKYRKPQKPQKSFENMLSDFLKNSDETLKNLKQRDQKY
ncbi:S1 RNA-binding domain-containing protein [Garciella nitratireducens]|uniref:S1 RNA binding domain protein n=1 Tax=Garciella nitratireducens DSM 15102 TaxID=1121911 RepID=A0A1T4M885_9FIRM|nr:S1 RNA-binding domain-containing protein [Garciella nitratireducens]RBP43993.1 S1 RNA binding domain protein [Garciella nitratireducens]SJZ63121.1 S1 RNA binding domain protein [Garciella nitratireducens DSM 15102]